jgi:hypothetical protein
MHQIPDLLDLLANVEFYRNYVLSKAKDSLVWNSYYKKNGQDTITLSPGQESISKKLESQNIPLRTIYMSLISQYCQFVSPYIFSGLPCLELPCRCRTYTTYGLRSQLR